MRYLPLLQGINYQDKRKAFPKLAMEVKAAYLSGLLE
jgi:hypothetical protein